MTHLFGKFLFSKTNDFNIILNQGVFYSHYLRDDRPLGHAKWMAEKGGVCPTGGYFWYVDKIIVEINTKHTLSTQCCDGLLSYSRLNPKVFREALENPAKTIVLPFYRETLWAGGADGLVKKINEETTKKSAGLVIVSNPKDPEELSDCYLCFRAY